MDVLLGIIAVVVLVLTTLSSAKTKTKARPMRNADAAARLAQEFDEQKRDAPNTVNRGFSAPFTNAADKRYFAAEQDDTEDEADDAPTSSQSSVRRGLPLFQDKNELVRAVIYAEILPRRGTRRRIG